MLSKYGGGKCPSAGWNGCSKLIEFERVVKNNSELTAEILKREELMSTAIGRGIAIPHVRLSSVTDLVMAVGICKKTVEDFETAFIYFDGKCVYI